MAMLVVMFQFEPCEAVRSCDDYYDCHSTEVCSSLHQCVCRVGFMRRENRTAGGGDDDDGEGCTRLEPDLEWSFWNIFEALLDYRVPQLFLLTIIFLAFAKKLFNDCRTKHYEHLAEDDGHKRSIA